MLYVFVATETLLSSVGWKFSQGVWKTTNKCKLSSSKLHTFDFRWKLQK